MVIIFIMFKSDSHFHNCVTPFKSVTKYCTGSTCLYYVALGCVTCIVQCSVTYLNGITKKDQIKHELWE